MGELEPGVPPPEGMEAWRSLTLGALAADRTRLLEPGMVITGVGAFSDLNTIEDRADLTVDTHALTARGATSAAEVADRPDIERLSVKWTPRSFHGTIVEGEAYVLPFTETVAAQFRQPRFLSIAEMCVPILMVGVLRYRARRIDQGFVASALYVPGLRMVGGRPFVRFNHQRFLDRPLGMTEIEQIVAAQRLDAMSVGRSLAAAAMRHPASGGSMGGAKRR